MDLYVASICIGVTDVSTVKVVVAPSMIRDACAVGISGNSIFSVVGVARRKTAVSGVDEAY